MVAEWRMEGAARATDARVPVWMKSRRFTEFRLSVFIGSVLFCSFKNQR
jgi:hypothetical protein